MHFLIENDDLLEKSNTIWNKVSADIKKEFHRKLAYNKKNLTTKIKPYVDKVTVFYGKETPKVDSDHTCLAVIKLDCTFNKHGNYYLQVFLKDWKYIEKLVIRYIIDDLESSSDDSDVSDEK